MEQVPKCKSLVATFEDDKLMLNGPCLVECDAGETKELHIKVEQCGIRKIIVRRPFDLLHLSPLVSPLWGFLPSIDLAAHGEMDGYVRA